MKPLLFAQRYAVLPRKKELHVKYPGYSRRKLLKKIRVPFKGKDWDNVTQEEGEARPEADHKRM